MFCVLKRNKKSPINVKVKKNNLVFRIIPKLSKFDARFGISGSFIEFNQIFEKKKAIEKPSNIKKVINHKLEKVFF